MAGSYPNADGRKFAWDEDGSVFWYIPNSDQTWDLTEEGIVIANATLAVGLNDQERPATGVYGEPTVITQGCHAQLACCLFFPENRNIDGVYWHTIIGNAQPSAPHYIEEIQYSTDTTNGVDGTWVVGLPDLDSTTDVISYYSGISLSNSYRTAIQSVNWLNARAVRFICRGTNSLFAPAFALAAFHIYGDIPTTQSPDRLLIIDNDTGSEFTFPQDWGDVPRGVTLDKEIKLRNNSTTLTANTISLTFEDINSAETSNTWYTIKEAGGSFGASLNYTGTIAAGADSNVITIRLTVADDEGLSLQEARMQVNVGFWT